jgi:hypothetical protein
MAYPAVSNGVGPPPGSRKLKKRWTKMSPAAADLSFL